MNDMVKMVVVLTLLAAASGFLLSFAEQKTAPLIEMQVLNNEQWPTLQTIFKDADNLDTLVDQRFKIDLGDDENVTIFPGVYNGEPKAVAFEAKSTGFGGPLGVMVAVNLDTDEMVAIGVTVSQETPGFGSRAKDEPDLANQFKGLGLLQSFSVKADGGDIDAITGATVTSRAVCAAVTSAGETYKSIKPEILEKVKAI
ncbi:electron transport complex protein RnfG [Desulfatibacillum alkenivorans DSM 16219]|jgi:electron transport complex protein RnfG|uniref:Ion-translocating oxidoreductase complex subunit G n=1 Tax=Desulfatibacillum alkenivorans DSM 16219 TaxID=1121393 RepID=A0A1M6KJB2_9BACT|nr:FMN-binding protein [Desulfatibacillum alkenivorans]SHJ59015.1 electron transport complex protein RnfG [Desulfatibacillum alkenivorans DSM 16219]